MPVRKWKVVENKTLEPGLVKLLGQAHNAIGMLEVFVLGKESQVSN